MFRMYTAIALGRPADQDECGRGGRQRAACAADVLSRAQAALLESSQRRWSALPVPVPDCSFCLHREPVLSSSGASNRRFLCSNSTCFGRNSRQSPPCINLSWQKQVFTAEFPGSPFFHIGGAQDPLLQHCDNVQVGLGFDRTRRHEGFCTWCLWRSSHLDQPVILSQRCQGNVPDERSELKCRQTDCQNQPAGSPHSAETATHSETSIDTEMACVLCEVSTGERLWAQLGESMWRFSYHPKNYYFPISVKVF